MARETKIGLLVGMGLILMVGIFVTDYLANARTPEPARMVDAGADSNRSITPQQTLGTQPPIDAAAQRQQTTRTQELPLPYEQAQQQQRQQPVQTQDTHREQFVTSERSEAGEVDTSSQTSQDSSTWRVDPVQLRRTTQGTQTTPPDSQQQQTVTNDRLISPPQPVYHYVKEQETLTEIAQRYYGDGRLWRVVRDANPTVVDPQGRTGAGVRLMIPNKASLASAQGGNGQSTTTDTPPQPRSDDWLIVPSNHRTVTVESGQTLSDIAREHLGSPAKWDELYELNRDVLKDPDQVPLGTVLKLPAATSTTQAPAAQRTTTTTQSPAATGPKRTYTVKSGDNLTRIAKSVYGDETAWRKIADANRATLADEDSLKVGDVLVLP